MNLQFVPLSFVFFAASFLTAGIAVAVWWHRHKAGGLLFFTLMAAIAEWSFAAGMEAIVIGESAKILWSQIEYFGLVATPPLLLLFSMSYTQRENWFNKRKIIALWIPPVIILTLTLTNKMHGLIWSGFTPGSVSANILIYHRGPLFWFSVAYAYLLILISFLIMLQAYRASHFPVKQQLGLVMIAVVFPMISSCFYILRIRFLQGMDITPLGFAVSGLMIAWSLFRFRFLDIIPVGRSAMVDKMPTGMLVLDEKSRIADINPAAMKLLDIKDIQLAGRPIESVFYKNFPLLSILCQKTESQSEILIDGKNRRILDVRISILTGKYQNIQGKLVILQDITERKKMEDELVRLATVDSLTGAKSRRYFMDKMASEFIKSKRYNRPLSFAIMDIDHFKKINDSHGHRVGDDVLREIVKKCHKAIREVDNFGRLGGEEFGFLFPETDAAGAEVVCERLRRDISSSSFIIDKKEIHCTISIGVSAINDADKTIDDLINHSDKALYDAKQKGRNRISIANSPEKERRPGKKINTKRKNQQDDSAKTEE
jgi:diguanylate cyclase (GGDEF)-like protein/PAS domain S-box-containing protein